MSTLTTRLERIRDIAGYFNELQGLKLIPVALFFLGIALHRSGIWYWFTIWNPVSTAVLLILCIIIYVLIGRYYRSQFGQAIALPSNNPSQQTWPAILFVILFIACGYIEFYAAAPVGLTSLVIAGGLFYIYYTCRPVRNHYLIWSAAVFIMGVLPLFGLYETAAVYLFGPDAIFSLVLLGLISLIAGILDHLTLTRSMPQTIEST